MLRPLVNLAVTYALVLLGVKLAVLVVKSLTGW